VLIIVIKSSQVTIWTRMVHISQQ